MYPTPERASEARSLQNLYALSTVLIAAALVAAALGSGNPDTPADAKLPAWVDVLANATCALLAALVLLPTTRGVASAATAVMMVVSMITNYRVDGLEFFLRALPFNLVTLALASWVAYRHLRS
ncbi:MAG: hypothetical protein AAGI01_05025 [Myxococcota bacterium]